ncbi:disease resistance protein PIK6-NP-like [Triticum urartu]|uniref:disease resistance protein PIK6-NP-like n=1 Tax=Triticum urartu TaxID=4572 RepID=UPI0020448A8C|nr:disease resistance protein PIK6-NP-like [Triticum urartu]
MAFQRRKFPLVSFSCGGDPRKVLVVVDEEAKVEAEEVVVIAPMVLGDMEAEIIVGGKGADLGQTSIIWEAYENPETKNSFPCRAWVRFMHPFSPEDFIQSLVEQFHTSVGVDLLLEAKKMGQELAEEFNGYVNAKKFLIVLNDLSTIEEWNRVKRCFPNNKKGSLIIVSTRQVEVASLCAGQESIVSELKQSSIDQNIYAFYEKVTSKFYRLCSSNGTDLMMVAGPSSKSAVTNGTDQSQGADWNHAMRKSFSCAMSMTTALEESHLVGRDKEMKKINEFVVFKETVYLDEEHPELIEQAELILKKCSGLPLAIVTIGGFLANQPKTEVEWRRLNEHISAELEINPKLGTILAVLTKSYDGLPYHLKSCFLYLPIFPEDYKVSRRRLVRRWTAEGYSWEVRGKSAEGIADNYFMELISRSMILPYQQSIRSRKGIDACHVYDLIREIGISKSMEENLVFRLEEGCSLNTQHVVRHLAISSNWEGNQSDLDSIIDMSRVRSITVFGKWKSLYISDKIRLLRVLDLEGTSGVFDHHLEDIVKLIHLKYLSLRGCTPICHLPDSLGNLKQLETLDLRGTQIVKLPHSIRKLRKLNYLRAGKEPMDEDISYEQVVEDLPTVMRNGACLLTVSSMVLCARCFAGSDFNGYNHRDLCSAFCCVALPVVAMKLDAHGVVVPRGVRKLKALHTLSVVNISRGRIILQNIRRLSGLRKLGVTGINKRNSLELRSTVSQLSRLESLSMRSEGMPGLSGCLDDMPTPPENLQSLKLYGNLVILPAWIQTLRNLVKLKLRNSRISDHGVAIQVLGELPMLAILCLWTKSFVGEVHFSFGQRAFPSLVVLHLDHLDDLKSLDFSLGGTPKLEVLQLSETYIQGSNGLEHLPTLKEVVLKGDYPSVEKLRADLAKFPNGPVVKLN